MLSYTDLKKGVLFIYNGAPHEVLEANFSRMQQRKAVVQTKIRNLTSSKTYDVTFQASDEFEEAEVEKRIITFLYQHRGEFIFIDQQNPPRSPAGDRDPGPKGLGTKNRFSLSSEIIGDQQKWLKPNTQLTAIFFKDKILKLILPIKMEFKVTEAPPGVQGDRAQSGTKSVTIETGAVVQTPLFINAGDIVRINTQTGEYAERAEKAS